MVIKTSQYIIKSSDDNWTTKQSRITCHFSWGSEVNHVHHKVISQFFFVVFDWFWSEADSSNYKPDKTVLKWQFFPRSEEIEVTQVCKKN